MKILVTGAAGFLGLHLANYLDKKGNSLILLDIAGFEKSEYPKNCQFVIGDIRDKSLMKKVTKDVDCVIHAAAALPLWNKKDILDINVKGTANLLSSSLDNKVKKFIYISSTAVYGVPKKHPIYEGDPLVGVGPYGESKIAAEKVCDQYRRKGLTVSVLRPKTFIGTYRLGVFEILFDWIKDGKKIPVIGNGKNRYQLLDVDDLVEAIYLLLFEKNKRKINKTFNIGAGKFNTVGTDLQGLFDYASSGSKILKTPAFFVKKTLWLFEKMKLSPLYRWVYDTADKDSFVSIDLLTKTLNWHPRYSNTEALIKAYSWYQKNYKKIKTKSAGITHTTGWKQGILGVIKKFM